MWQDRVAAPLARHVPLWVTPGWITGARLGLSVVVLAFLLRGKPGLALAVYVLALLTDAVDGAVARIRRAETRFGARFDPVADKVLHAAVFLAFFAHEPLLIGLVLALDAILLFVGFGVLLSSAPVGADVRASDFGKWKLALQAVAIFALFWNVLQPVSALPDQVVELSLSAAVLFAVLSMVGYTRMLLSPRTRP